MGALRIGIVGARGYVGAELIHLIIGHPTLELAYVGSRELAGQPVASRVERYRGALTYTDADPARLLDADLDVAVLALPNDKAGAYVAALDAVAAQTLIVDLSADYRFNPAWFYGLPEINRAHAAGQRRISNPGCYATAMQLAIHPLRDWLARPAQCFGVSGYSGAGTAPSDKNDSDKLRDNLMPYALVGHIHEREVTRHLGHPVEFMPHVAPWFRGISMTVNLHFKMQLSGDELRGAYESAYANEPLIDLCDAPPWVSHIQGRNGAQIGGFSLSADRRRAVVVATLDNLLKGAATQALQNVNLALGLPELAGISP